MFITVSETWRDVHTNEQREALHVYLDELESQGAFVRVSPNGDRSIYDSSGAPTKVFSSTDSALDYLKYAFNNLGLGGFVVKSFDTIDSLNIFLSSFRDPNYPREQGPDR